MRATPATLKDPMMHTTRPNLFTRDDTFFGVCEGLGEDFRIPSNLLRLGLTLTFFFYPFAALSAYAAAGAVVLLSRLLVPNPRPMNEAAAPALQDLAARDATMEEETPEPVALAA